MAEDRGAAVAGMGALRVPQVCVSVCVCVCMCVGRGWLVVISVPGLWLVVGEVFVVLWWRRLRW